VEHPARIATSTVERSFNEIPRPRKVREYASKSPPRDVPEDHPGLTPWERLFANRENPSWAYPKEDVERQRVEVYRQPDVEFAAYAERTTVQAGDVLAYQAVPGLSIPFKDIW
jgi:hypothetical protein